MESISRAEATAPRISDISTISSTSPFLAAAASPVHMQKTAGAVPHAPVMIRPVDKPTSQFVKDQGQMNVSVNNK